MSGSVINLQDYAETVPDIRGRASGSAPADQKLAMSSSSVSSNTLGYIDRRPERRKAQSTPSNRLIRMTYRSELLHNVDIWGIIEHARAKNGKLEIGGALWYDFETRRVRQILEGLENVVETLVSKIIVDPRHTSVVFEATEYPTKRHYSQWMVKGALENKKRRYQRLLSFEGEDLGFSIFGNYDLDNTGMPRIPSLPDNLDYTYSQSLETPGEGAEGSNAGTSRHWRTLSGGFEAKEPPVNDEDARAAASLLNDIADRPTITAPSTPPLTPPLPSRTTPPSLKEKPSPFQPHRKPAEPSEPTYRTTRATNIGSVGSLPWGPAPSVGSDVNLSSGGSSVAIPASRMKSASDTLPGSRGITPTTQQQQQQQQQRQQQQQGPMKATVMPVNLIDLLNHSHAMWQKGGAASPALAAAYASSQTLLQQGGVPLHRGIPLGVNPAVLGEKERLELEKRQRQAMLPPHPMSALHRLAAGGGNKIHVYNKEEKRQIIRRYLAKKKGRKFKKVIRYACRKRFADRRPRVGGRFVKMKPEPKPEPKPDSESKGGDTASDAKNGSETAGGKSRGTPGIPGGSTGATRSLAVMSTQAKATCQAAIDACADEVLAAVMNKPAA